MECRAASLAHVNAAPRVEAAQQHRYTVRVSMSDDAHVNGTSAGGSGSSSHPEHGTHPQRRKARIHGRRSSQSPSAKRRGSTRKRSEEHSGSQQRHRRRPQRERARTFQPFTPSQLAERAAAIPLITYPDLPVSARRNDIAEAIRNHQVVIVSGETGSGKTTQLPKICMQLGRGVNAMIGHTQPRRLAARSVADRIAEELGQKVGRDAGQVVGYQVRFTDEVGPTTLVKLMTDGILLAEIQSDPMLRRYDTLIIDEAHERSLNIDFILGYLARLLPMRTDLKVIITSATIDSERFARHFGRWEGEPGRGRLIEAAPVIEVSGRTYPVEIRYRPLSPDLPHTYSTTSPALSAPTPPGREQRHVALPGDTEISTTGTSTHTAAAHTGHPQNGAPARETPRESTDGQTTPFQQLVLEDPDDDLPTLGYGLGDDLDVEQGICAAVDELLAEDATAHATHSEGDILVFLPGERDIRDTEQALLDHLGSRAVKAGEDRHAPPGSVEIIPLYARLTSAEQHRVFEPHRLRRIVLATNVAETSLTVPGIRYVIDPGFARISRYSNRTKVQRLPIEPISQASANQRAGRSGRVADGIAIRLYSQRDYASRPQFTEPEILRTSLASVILHMASLGLGSVQDFPFLDAPERRAIRDGVQLLVEIGALRAEDDGSHSLTSIGRELARLPIDPRLGRMLLEGDANGCASEVLVIVAALAIQDVRERPLEHQAAADASHARFADPHSDFITYLNLWRYLHVQQRDLSGSAFRRLCRAEFLHYMRFREWRDVVQQLRQMARPLDVATHPIGIPSAADVIEAASVGGIQDAAARAVVAYTQGANSVDADEIHRSLLVGLLSNLGSWDETKREYQGARGTRFTVWPGSGLARSHPSWVMSAELVETSRLFARTVARIRPEWIEPLATRLIKRVYSEPYWSSSKGAAMVKEKVLLYGLTLSADRPVLLGRLKDTVIGSAGNSSASQVATPGTLAGIAQGLLGQHRHEDPSRGRGPRRNGELGSVGRDILALAVETEEKTTASPKPPRHIATEVDEYSPAALPDSDDTIPATSHEPDMPESALTARVLARDMFITHALVAGEWREHHAFQKRNEELLDQAREVERRSRTHGLVADDEVRYRFFDEILPDDIVSAGHFNRWWKKQRHATPDLLTYTPNVLLPVGVGRDGDGFPDFWEHGDVKLPLSYQFSPGSARDGVTMTIPIEVLQRVDAHGADWLVPGMLEELTTETIRALPKAKRRLLAPAPEVGQQVATRIRSGADASASHEDDARPLTHTEAQQGEDPMSLSAAMSRLAQWGEKTGHTSRRKSRTSPAAPADSREGAVSFPASVPSRNTRDDATSPRDKTEGTPRAETADSAGQQPLFAQVFAQVIRDIRGVDLSADDLRYAEEHLPDHLRMTYVVVDRSGRELGSGQDLVYLQRSLAQDADDAVRHAVRNAVAQAFEDAQRDRTSRRGRTTQRHPHQHATTDSPSSSERPDRPRGQETTTVSGSEETFVKPTGDMRYHNDGLVDFPAEPLPRSVESESKDHLKLRGFPTLIGQGDAPQPKAGVRVMANASHAESLHRVGLAHLLLIRVALPTARVTTRWTGREALMLAASPYPNTEALVADAQLASAAALVDALSPNGDPASIRDRGAFESLVTAARSLHEDKVYEILGHVVRAMEAHSAVDDALRKHPESSMRHSVHDVQETTARLIPPGFVSATPAWALPHIARYLRAGAVRITRASSSASALQRDAEDMARIHELSDLIDEARARTDQRPYDKGETDRIEQAAWMLEELRVSLFAQQLGTPMKVSAKRIRSLLEG